VSGGIDFFFGRAATGLSLLEAEDNKKNPTSRSGDGRIDRLNKTAGQKWNKGVGKFSN